MKTVEKKKEKLKKVNGMKEKKKHFVWSTKLKWNEMHTHHAATQWLYFLFNIERAHTSVFRIEHINKRAWQIVSGLFEWFVIFFAAAASFIFLLSPIDVACVRVLVRVCTVYLLHSVWNMLLFLLRWMLFWWIWIDLNFLLFQLELFVDFCCVFAIWTVKR